MRYIVVDLEATCWENVRSTSKMEIIEIGAVELLVSSGPTSREFDIFVRPTESPELSRFCQRLTTIQQSDVDQADPFPAVLPRFVEWIGPEPFVLCSWGQYDLDQFRVECNRHRLQLPTSFERHINLKKEFAGLRKMDQCGLKPALALVSLTQEGTHHRGLDDARNIAKLAMLDLPRLEEAGAVVV